MPEIMIIERQSRWTPELQRQVQALPNAKVFGAGEAFSVNPCRTWAGLRPDQIAAGTVIVVDLNFGVAECLHFLGRMFPHLEDCRVVIIGSPSTHSLEWTFYEMGVTVYLAECHHGEQLMNICRRLMSASKRTS
ncbi:MAG: hypothetical protein O2955_07550 [Planctomycetota bacterium]|nr:hypothetical protein [Planctomycetota bacterium]MDA1212354.1 hypothetical protein [Planctomycetota bacterium]